MHQTTMTWVIAMSFSRRLAKIRKDTNMTQQKMADVIGIHVSQIKRYESGETQPSLEVLRKIAIALNISADVLLFDVEERQPPQDFDMQFQAINQFTDEEKSVTKTLLDSLILKHTASRLVLFTELPSTDNPRLNQIAVVTSPQSYNANLGVARNTAWSNLDQLVGRLVALDFSALMWRFR